VVKIALSLLVVILVSMMSNEACTALSGFALMECA
jgi:hypothetical protein